MATSSNRRFYERPNTPKAEIDYIQIVNELLNNDPAGVDPSSNLYQKAVEQFNSDVNKASTTRLEVPEGFCGFIDPDTGVFRVVPEPDEEDLLTGTVTPPQDPVVDPTVTLTPLFWPVDECLQNGLPGSPDYTQTNDGTGQLTDVVCGTDDDVSEATGIDWTNMTSEGAGVPEQATIDYWNSDEVIAEYTVQADEQTKTAKDNDDSSFWDILTFSPILGTSTVICTELHRQGILSEEIYQADMEYTKTIHPLAYSGYHCWAKHIANKMKTSKRLTRVASFFALPWAKEMAYRTGKIEKGSLFGSVILAIGYPICYLVGCILLINALMLSRKTT